jgi:hypothetical protein
MLYSNEASVKTLKTFIMIAGFICIIAMTGLIFLQQFMILAFVTGFFLTGLIIVSILNFQYVHIGEKGNKLIVRFYSVFSVDRNYKSIEIPLEHLRQVKVNKLFLGLKWDLKFIVRIRQGIAEYPPLSLSAVSFKDRKNLITALKLLISSANSTN